MSILKEIEVKIGLNDENPVVISWIFEAIQRIEGVDYVKRK